MEQIENIACVGNLLFLQVGAGFTMCVILLCFITHTHVPSILLCVEYCEIKSRNNKNAWKDWDLTGCSYHCW